MRRLLAVQDLGSTARAALSASMRFLQADYGLVVYVDHNRELVHFEAQGLHLLPYEAGGSDSAKPDGLPQRHPLRQWVKRCHVLLEGRELFERKARIWSYVGKDGKDRFVFHRLFEERFETYVAVPLRAGGQVVGELTLGFRRDIGVSASKRQCLSRAAPNIGAALLRADQESDLRALLPLMRDLAQIPAEASEEIPAQISAMLHRLLSFTKGRGAILRVIEEPSQTRSPAAVRLLGGAGDYYEWARENLPFVLCDLSLEPLLSLKRGEAVMLQARDRPAATTPDQAAGKRGLAPPLYWEGVESMALLPLGRPRWGRHLMYLELHLGPGVFCSPGRFEVLESLAESLGFVLNFAHIKHENRLLILDQASRLLLLRDLSRQLLTAKDFANYQDLIAETSYQHLHAEISTVFLYNKKHCILERVAWYPSFPELAAVSETYEPHGECRGVTGMVLGCKEGEHLLFNEPQEIAAAAISSHLQHYACLPSWKLHTRNASPSPVRHLLVVPIIGENGKVFGALRAINKRSSAYTPSAPGLDEKGFNESDHQLLKTIAAILASKLSSERRAGRLEALNVATGKIAAAASDRDVAAVVVQTVVRDLGYSSCSFRFLTDRRLESLAREGFETSGIQDLFVSADVGLVGKAISTGQTQTALDILSRMPDENQGYQNVAFARKERLRGACCVPIRSEEGKVYGAIIAYMRGLPYQFFPYETHLLETIATAACVTLHKLAADQRARTAERRLKRLVSILELLLASESRRDVFDSAFPEILALLEADAGALFRALPLGSVEGVVWEQEPTHSFGIDTAFSMPLELVRKTNTEGPQIFLSKDYAGLRPLQVRNLVHGMSFSLWVVADLLGGVVILNRADPTPRIQFEERKNLASTVGLQLARTFRNLDLAQERARIERALPAIASAQLASGMVHEINNKANTGINTITGIIGSRAFERFPLGVQEELRVVDESFASIGRLARDYLNFNKPVRHAVDVRKGRETINTVVRDALYSLKDIIRKARCETDLDSDLEREFLSFDRSFIGLATENLIRNALRWIHEGGRIVISTGKRDGWSYIRVEDWGEGIDRAIVDTIFNPFFSLSRDGVGLGLTISRFIVEDLHAGRLSLVQRRDPTTFEILLPSLASKEARR